MIREKLGHKQRTVSERQHYTISGETQRLVPLGKKQVTLGIDTPWTVNSGGTRASSRKEAWQQTEMTLDK